MTVDESPTDTRQPDGDLSAADVAWDIDSILPEGTTPADLFDRADVLADDLTSLRGRVGTLDAGELAEAMHTLAELEDLMSRAGYHAMLAFSTATDDPARGAAVAAAQERSTAIGTKLIFIDLEWAAADDDHVAAVLADPRLDFCRHHLDNLRLSRPYLLSEAEETIVAEKSQTGFAAWTRLFDELTSAITVDLPDEFGGPGRPLMQAASILQHPDRAVRKQVAEGITAGPRTGPAHPRLPLQHAAAGQVDRRPSAWLPLVDLVAEPRRTRPPTSPCRHSSTPSSATTRSRSAGTRSRRRCSGSTSSPTTTAWRRSPPPTANIGWAEGTQIVRDAYASFSPELAGIVDRFIDESWIDAPVRPGKRGGAFAAGVSPDHHPYVLLNWTSKTRDVATLAHELGHGVHFYLAREQGIFHQSTPLTLAETASVFGETVTSNRLLSMIDDPNERFALLASSLEDSIATVFRQIAMNRFEHSVHTARRTEGELSVERFGDLWAESQHAMLGDSVEITDGYRNWWSYVPHFMGSPGYVYAYAYGQLLALSVYARYQEEGDAFVPAYLDLLRAGGSDTPENLARIVDCDLADPNFWRNGLQIVEGQLTAAEDAARAAGRLS